MRITRKKYDRARSVVDDAREQMKLIKQWDEAIKQVEHPERVDAITVNDDGSIRFELLHHGRTPKQIRESASASAVSASREAEKC